MHDLAPVQAFSPSELAVVRSMLQKKINTPRTSSAGRLFDAVAALASLQQIVHFEGQAALHLEFALDGIDTDESYRVEVIEPSSGSWQDPLIVDWAPLVRAVLDDLRRGMSIGRIAAKFHNALVEAIVAVAFKTREEHLVLLGGCFQNKYLTERAVSRLRSANFHPYWHRHVPPNDGGIAVGQVVAAAQELRGKLPEASARDENLTNSQGPRTKE